MSKPIITIIIATFNSAKLLPMVLDSIKAQTFPQKDIEILLVDGGSTDATYEVAKKYKCRIIDNPKTEPVYAKFLGFLNAKGKYVVYLDHDEVIENKDSLQIKYNVFQSHHDVKAVIGSGYKNPKGYAFINNYINEFGDPFSFFIYKLSKDTRFFLREMKKRYPLLNENKEFVVFNLSNINELPIIELCAVGSMTDSEYIKRNFPETLKKPELIPHFFYLLHTQAPLLGMTKKDGLIHYSSDTFKKYLNKIRWRVKNNIYHRSDMGESGFSGREKYQSITARYKKYFYLPYVYTLVLCLADAIYLSLTRKNYKYLIHVPLSIFTANLITYHTVMKMLGNKPKLKSYDESKIVR